MNIKEIERPVAVSQCRNRKHAEEVLVWGKCKGCGGTSVISFV